MGGAAGTPGGDREGEGRRQHPGPGALPDAPGRSLARPRCVSVPGAAARVIDRELNVSSNNL